MSAGWKNEGTGWYAPASGSPVYRLYNKNAGNHHYTLNQEEKEFLVKSGWKFEGIGWYSESDKGAKLYRAYNKNTKAGSHNYTLSNDEQTMLVKAGWKNEGIAWYGMKPTKPTLSGVKDTTVKQGTTFNSTMGITGTDFLGQSLKVSVSGNVDTTKAGTYTLTYSVVDQEKQLVTETRKVTVESASLEESMVSTKPAQKKPVITGIKDITITQTTTAFDTKKGISAKDSSGKSLSVQVTGSVNTKKAGIYTLTYSAKDDQNQVTTATRKVTVNKVANPTITGVKDSTFEQTAATFDLKKGITAKDASGKALDVKTTGSVDTNKVGTYTISYMATDGFGNTSTVKRKVTVTQKPKNQNPVFTGIKDVEVVQSISNFDEKKGITAKDASGKELAYTVFGYVSLFTPGVYELTYSVTDSNWNHTEVKRKVTVKEAPESTITGIDPVVITQSNTEFDRRKNVSAQDYTGKKLDLWVTGILSVYSPGTYELTYSTVDDFGRSIERKRKVTVKPSQAIITGAKDTTINQTTTAFDAYAGVSAKDSSGKASKLEVSGSVDTKKVGAYTLNYKATDEFGNVTNLARKVTVKKVANPIISGVKDTAMNQTLSFDAKDGITAKDASGKALDIKVSGAIDTKKVGVYTFTYTATDAFGNASTATRKVTVKKVANPTISGVKDTAINQTLSFDAKAGITAKDASGKALDVKVSGALDTKKVGTYTVTYTATDVFGNTATATRKVAINKVANPTITGVKDISINKSTGMFDFDKGISAKDASGKTLDIAMKTNLTKENPKSGMYTVTYMATDVFGNSTSQNQNVTIVNDIKPVFTGVQATDGDGNVVAFTVTGAVDFTKPGNNEITYTAKDAAGNETTVKRNVEVFAIAVSSIEISGNTQLHTNEESQLSAMINPTDAWQKDLSWISSNPSIVEVDQTGKIKTLAEGSATVTATAKNGVKQSVEILVSDRIDGYVGSTGYASINGRLTQISFKFSSQDSRTLTVKQATVTGGAFGPITYTQQDYKDKGLPTEIAPYSSLDFSFSNYIGFQQGATTVELLLEASNGTQRTITQGF